MANNNKNFNIKYLEWFLSFIQTDISQLTSKEYLIFKNAMPFILAKEENKEDIIKYQKILKTYFNFIIKRMSPIEKQMKDKNCYGWKPLAIQSDYKISLSLVCDDTNCDIYFIAHPGVAGIIKDLKFELISMLNEIPCKAFKKCPECTKLFIHVTKKIKIYCCNKCASRHIVRRQRKEKKNNYETI